MIEIDDKMAKLLSHYSYSKNIDISEYGVWQMFGEDPNCAFGRDNPSIGYAEGTFLDVLAYASTLPIFYSWGSGGYIKKHTFNVTKIKKGFHSDLINGVFEREQNELKKEKEKIEKEREKLEKRLEELNSKIVK